MKAQLRSVTGGLRVIRQLKASAAVGSGEAVGGTFRVEFGDASLAEHPGGDRVHLDFLLRQPRFPTPTGDEGNLDPPSQPAYRSRDRHGVATRTSPSRRAQPHRPTE
jgi:hypothetical protein